MSVIYAHCAYNIRKIQLEFSADLILKKEMNKSIYIDLLCQHASSYLEYMYTDIGSTVYLEILTVILNLAIWWSQTQPLNQSSPTASSTSTSISGLQLGTGYRVRVAAVTQLGTGAYSSDVAGITYNGECTGEYTL